MLKGKTKIELFENGRTVHKIEDTNTVTGAIDDIFRGVGLYNNGTALLESGTNLTRLFGGLLCFDKEIDETVTIAPAGAKIIAAGVYGEINGGANQVRGSFNSTESAFDGLNKQMTLVYDFTTNQGNGEIVSVCLTPLFGGYLNEGRPEEENTKICVFPVDFNKQPMVYWPDGKTEKLYPESVEIRGNNNSMLPFTHGYIARGLTCAEAEKLNGKGEPPYSSPDEPRTNQHYGNLTRTLEYNKPLGLALNATMSLDETNVSVTFKLFDIPSQEVSAFYNHEPKEWTTEQERTITLGSPLYPHAMTLRMSYDYERRKLYIISPKLDVANSWKHTMHGGNACNKNSKIKIWAIDLTDVYDRGLDYITVTPTEIPNLTDGPLAMLNTGYRGVPALDWLAYNGFLYVYSKPERSDVGGETKLWKIDINSPANVKVIGNIKEAAYTYINDIQDGRIFYCAGRGIRGQDVWTLNTELDTISYQETRNPDYEDFSVIPIRGDLGLVTLGGHAIGFRPNTLMTINNISTVTKTAAQTMKITYTIGEM